MFIGTCPFFLHRNVPGVALYMTSLTQMRTFLARSPYFAHIRRQSNAGSGENVSVLPSLTPQGNLLAGATTRVAVGFLLNPFSVIKTRFEVWIPFLWYYPSVFSRHLTEQHLRIRKSWSCFRFSRSPGSIWTPPRILSIIPTWCTLLWSIRCLLWRHQGWNMSGFLAFQFLHSMHSTCYISLAYLFPPKSNGEATVIHGLSAASAGAIATLATHPFDVIKVGCFCLYLSRLIWWRFWNCFFFRPKCRYAPKIGITAFSGLYIQYGRWVAWYYMVWNTLTCCCFLWIQQRGVAGFFDGASLRITRKVCSSAIGWVVYEGVLMFMRTPK